MTTWKAILAVLGVFVFGTVFGLAISFWIAPERGASGPRIREVLIHRLNQRLVRELSLSKEQEKAVSAIIGDATKQLAEIRKETRPRVRRTLADAQVRIREQLDPQQQERFDDMLKRNRRILNRALNP